MTRKQNPNYTVLRYIPNHKDAEKLKVKCGEDISESNRKKAGKTIFGSDKRNKLQFNFFFFFFAIRGWTFFPAIKASFILGLTMPKCACTS